MKCGTILPHIGPLAAGPGVLDSLLSVAQKAEAPGFDSLGVGDHVVLPLSIKPGYPYNDTGEFPLPAEAALLEPLTVLGFLTGVTQRVRLGPSVLVLLHRNPIVTAKMFASLDVLSRGRIIFGAGIGLDGGRNSPVGGAVQPARRAERRIPAGHRRASGLAGIRPGPCAASSSLALAGSRCPRA